MLLFGQSNDQISLTWYEFMMYCTFFFIPHMINIPAIRFKILEFFSFHFFVCFDVQGMELYPLIQNEFQDDNLPSKSVQSFF